jgi:hypothetical protein
MYSWQEIKNCLIDKPKDELQAKMQRSYLFDFFMLSIMVVITETMSFCGYGETGTYIFFERVGLAFFAFTIADYLSYKTVRDYMEKREKEKESVNNPNS